MMKKDEPPVRLALRQEGDWWVAYLASTGTMKGSLEIGRVLMGIVASNEDNRRAFMDLMSKALSDAIEHEFGVRPERIEERPAPEHEKYGNA